MKKIDTNLFGFISNLVIVFLICFATLLYGQKQPYSSSEFIRNATMQMDKDGISPTFIKFQEGSQPTVITFLSEYKKSFLAFSSADNELRYNDLLAPMVKAIQELNLKCEELKSENDELKNNNEKISAEVESLKSMSEKLVTLEQLVNEMTSIKQTTFISTITKEN